MRPVIAELLRTCVQHALQLRVERVAYQEVADEFTEDGKSRLRRISRVYLTDNELVLQGILLPDLGLDLQVDDVLKIHKYSVRKARRSNRPGHVVFLAIQDCDVIARAAEPIETTAADEEGGFIRDASSSTFTSAPTSSKHSSLKRSEVFEDTEPPPSKQPRFDIASSSTSEVDNMGETPASQHSDDFEVVTPDALTTQKRRQALRQIDGNASPYFKTPSKKPHFKETTPMPSPSPPIDLPVITPLAALPGVQPSTPVTVLVAVSWTGQALLRPSQAFPPKRHVKLHDISIGDLFSGVSLACYIDAANFMPERGAVALLQDVVVQRCGSGSGEVNECFMLNAYANLPAKLLEQGVESKWCVDDEHELERLGLEAEVDELKDWWKQRETKRSNLATQSTQGRRAGG